MASTLFANSVKTVSNTLKINPMRVLSTSAVACGDENTKKYKKMNDPLDHKTGLEKYMDLAAKTGHADPFFFFTRPTGEGTRANPFKVYSPLGYRAIGCKCRKYDPYMRFRMYEVGIPKRCRCGYWIEVKQIAPITKEELPL